MTLFNTWVNFKEESQETFMEENTLPSETQPDEVLTVREMLERHVHGLPVHGNEGVYLPEEVGFIPDYRSLDLTEIDEYRQSFGETVQSLTSPPPATAGGTPDTEPSEVGDQHPDPPTPTTTQP